jgi:signal transduction histidine kinase
MSTETCRSRILVIDDELGPRESIRFLLNEEHDVYCADGVDSGVALMREESPDVIIMDIKMPEKNGIQGLREIRDIDEDVSVVMLTGFGTLETAQEAIRLGATDYLKKPFDTGDLREMVVRYVEQTKSARVARMRNETAEQVERINTQLQKEVSAKEHLATLGQASSEFVHDLRNPLSVICGYVQLLIDDLRNSDQWQKSTPRETIDYLEIIAKNAQRCQEMSNMWRDLASNKTLETENIDLASVIGDLVESCTPLAAEKGASIVTVPGAQVCRVAANRLQLFRALQNVLTNALQALPPRRGQVILSWETDDQGLQVVVEDNGCGIPDNQIAAVFAPGYSTKGQSDGMGLGLFITKKVIEGHGGTISLVNRPEGGVRATVRFPRAR